MPIPTLSQFWRGHAPTTDEPGGYRILRVLSVGSGAYSQINIRDAAYAGAADGATDASARGILRMVTILNNSATAGESVRISLAASGGNPVPADAYNLALINGPAVELRIPAHLATTTFAIKAEAGTPQVQLELWYDVPPA